MCIFSERVMEHSVFFQNTCKSSGDCLLNQLIDRALTWESEISSLNPSILGSVHIHITIFFFLKKKVPKTGIYGDVYSIFFLTSLPHSSLMVSCGAAQFQELGKECYPPLAMSQDGLVVTALPWEMRSLGTSVLHFPSRYKT